MVQRLLSTVAMLTLFASACATTAQIAEPGETAETAEISAAIETSETTEADTVSQRWIHPEDVVQDISIDARWTLLRPIPLELYAMPDLPTTGCQALDSWRADPGTLRLVAMWESQTNGLQRISVSVFAHPDNAGADRHMTALTGCDGQSHVPTDQAVALFGNAAKFFTIDSNTGDPHPERTGAWSAHLVQDNMKVRVVMAPETSKDAEDYGVFLGELRRALQEAPHVDRTQVTGPGGT